MQAVWALNGMPIKIIDMGERKTPRFHDNFFIHLPISGENVSITQPNIERQR